MFLLLKPAWRFPSGFWDSDRMVIVIDAGHGGQDPGASGNGQVEKELALDVAQRLQKQLEGRGWRVVTTREDDTFIPLSERVRISNKEKHAVFISLHFNKGENTAASGIETFYYTPPALTPILREDALLVPEAEALAGHVQTALIARMGTLDRGIKNRPLYVLRNARHPAILVECGFLSNRMEALLASGAGYRQKLAAGIAEGVEFFLKNRHANPSQ